MNLNWLLILPLLSVLLLCLLPKPGLSRTVALLSAILQVGLLSWITGLFYAHPHHQVSGAFMYESSYTWFAPLNIFHHTGLDGISLSMCWLTALVVLAGVLVSWKVDTLNREFFALLLLLSVGAYGFFISLNLFTLFFFLELAVIPKFLLIGIWGSGRKAYSATKLVLMLMTASALVLVAIMGLYYQPDSAAHSFSISYLVANPPSLNTQLFFFPFAFVGFGIFTALFPFHTWVPDGHSSAPTAGSMFLAGISMKLGGYGCLRMAVLLMPEAAQYYSPIIVGLAAFAILYGAFATMMQTDLKYINAYSSISHCGFVLLGIGMLTPAAVAGAVLQMVSHGLMTALFFAVIGIIYHRTHTRLVAQMGGLMKVMPFAASVFMIAGLCSLGLPGFSGFVAEMMVLVGSWQRTGAFYKWSTIIAAASIVVTAVYILQAIAKVIMGPLKTTDTGEYLPITWYEKWGTGLLVLAIVIMGIAPFIIQKLVSPGVGATLQKIVALY